jgi:hypothetical protein
MESQFKKFNDIWLNYSNISISTPHDFNKYILIIYQIEKNNFNFSEYKNDFINLIEILSTAILCFKYNYNYFIDDDVDYDENNNYEFDEELNCCYKIKKYLNSKF